MSDVFENVFGQPHVREFLRASVHAGRVSHAYLFTGPAGSNKTTAAYALAAAVLCERGGCGSCEVCARVERRKHPDVRFYAPEGAGGYLVDQVREIVADTSLAPIQADRKVYILDRADLLGVQAANAFLKTLEEPPADVVLILLGRTREAVLPTIVSRCQVVPFRHIPAAEAAGILAQNTGAAPEQAAIAIQCCDGSITKAAAFLRSHDRAAFRARVLEVLSLLSTADDLDVLGYAAELLEKAKLPLDDVRKVQEETLAENADFLAASAVRQIEQRNKRELSARSLELVGQLAAIVRSWLRDVLMAASGAPELVVNVDVRESIERAAAQTTPPSIVAALSAAQEMKDAIAYNVSPETCIDVMLFEVREALYGSYRPCRAAI